MTSYLQTRTGRLYWAEPERYVFTIGEIAESLSRICRFNGHLGWESVATHSIRVARALGYAAPRVQLAALLHDAHEAYIGDIPGPLLRAGLAGPLVAVGWGIQAAIIAQLAPACRGLNCAELAAIDREDRADCARTLALGPPDYEPPWPPARAHVADRLVALYVQLATERATDAVLPSPHGGAEKTGADD